MPLGLHRLGLRAGWRRAFRPARPARGVPGEQGGDAEESVWLCSRLSALKLWLATALPSAPSALAWVVSMPRARPRGLVLTGSRDAKRIFHRRAPGGVSYLHAGAVSQFAADGAALSVVRKACKTFALFITTPSRPAANWCSRKGSF